MRASRKAYSSNNFFQNYSIYSVPPARFLRKIFQFDEDCLHAQINVPSKLLEKRKTEQGYHYVLKSDAANAKLPVMVYFYGGAYTSGANYIYQPQYITEHGDVIVVVPNYR